MGLVCIEHVLGFGFKGCSWGPKPPAHNIFNKNDQYVGATHKKLMFGAEVTIDIQSAYDDPNSVDVNSCIHFKKAEMNMTDEVSFSRG